MSVGARPERPILEVSFSVSDFEIVARGMDELHLQKICTAICSDQHEVFDGKPKVILLETICKSAVAEGKYIRHAGGSGNYGHVRLRLEPRPEGAGFEFASELLESTLPSEYAVAAERGVREAAFSGVLLGYEVTDVKATLIDASHHEMDSNPMAFQIAGSLAFKEAAKKASPVVLEPIMAVKFMADLTSVQETVAELNARRGRIENMESYAGWLEIAALVPLLEMLNSSKYGRPDYPMEFARYERTRCPPDRFGEDGIGVTANLPKLPHTGRRSAAVQPDIAFD
jgi:elongation factor G